MNLTEISIKLCNHAKKQMKGLIGINATILHVVFEQCTIMFVAKR